MVNYLVEPAVNASFYTSHLLLGSTRCHVLDWELPVNHMTARFGNGSVVNRS